LTGFEENEIEKLMTQYFDEAPETFDEFDEDDVETEYRCPKCNYEWSGKPR